MNHECSNVAKVVITASHFFLTRSFSTTAYLIRAKNSTKLFVSFFNFIQVLLR